MGKKGMSLMELLAVIVLIGILLAITIPMVTKTIKTSSLKLFETEAKNILQAIENKKIRNSNFDVSSINIETMKTQLGIDNDNYQSITVKMVNDSIYITIVGTKKWDGYIACGTADDISLQTDETKCL